MNLNDLELSVSQWAHDRNLIKGTTPDKQFIKLVEEIGEVAACLAKDQRHKLKLEMGDMLVVLIILAEQNNMTINECLLETWHKIKDRKGMMVDGFFIKEQDLPPEGHM